MTNRLLIPLLVLSAFVSAGTEAETREVIEQEVPVAVATQVSSALRLRAKRAETGTVQDGRNSALIAHRLQATAQQLSKPLAPHGRPDNTRGDPNAC